MSGLKKQEYGLTQNTDLKAIHSSSKQCLCIYKHERTPEPLTWNGCSFCLLGGSQPPVTQKYSVAAQSIESLSCSSLLICEWWNERWKCHAFNPGFWCGQGSYIRKLRLAKKCLHRNRFFLQNRDILLPLRGVAATDRWSKPGYVHDFTDRSDRCQPRFHRSNNTKSGVLATNGQR